MSMVRLWAALLLALGLAIAPVQAQDLRAMARIAPENSQISDFRRGIAVALTLSQAVPYKLTLLDGPPRLRLSFHEVNWGGVDLAALDRSDHVTGLATGHAEPGWSDLTLTLDRPYEVSSAELRINEATGGADLSVQLRATDRTRFTQLVTPEPAAPIARPDPAGPRSLRIALDPGHGGFDPGARNGGYSEAVLMLTFVRELREKLVRVGGYEVILTRNADVFVPLPERVAIARRGGADLFLSFHADALEAGRARGATVYTLSDVASNQASELLAGRLNRADLLAGVDLSDADDLVATALMELARRETRPRSEALAGHLVHNISRALGGMHKSPRMAADFAVLRAPDIPSALIEMGFLSDAGDLENLLTPTWRDQAAQGVLDAIEAWALEDRALAPLRRQ